MQAKLYFGDFDKMWSYLQFLYCRNQGESPARGGERRALYRNALLSVLGQMFYSPGCRAPVAQSLYEFANRLHHIDGLESLFLASMSWANRTGQQDQFQKLRSAWELYGAEPSASGAGPLTFFNLDSNCLSLFTADVATALRIGGAQVNCLSLVQTSQRHWKD